jgi:PAS domain S-box-containing protein
VVRIQDSAQLPQIHVLRSLLAAIVESSEDAIISKALDGTILSWNRGAEQTYGYAAEEIVGQPIARLAPPDRRQEVDEITTALARGEGRRNFQTVRMRKDGGTFHVSLTVSPLRDTGGRIIGGAAISRDVSAQKEAEETLRLAKEELEERVKARTAELVAANAALEADIRQREQAERALAEQQRVLRTIVEQAADGIAVRDVEGRLIFANPAMKQTARVPPEGTGLELATEVWGETRDADGNFVPVDRWPVSRALQGETVTGVEWHRRAPDGSAYVFLNSAAPLRDERGRIIGAVSVTTDITARKRAEEALREADRRYRLLFERSLAGVYRAAIALRSREVRWLDCNDAFASYFGYPGREAVLRAPAHEIFPSQEAAAAYLERLMQARVLTNYEVELRRQDGSPMWALLHVGLTLEGDGSHGLIEGTLIDATERKRAEQGLLAQKRLLETILEQATDGMIVCDRGGRFLFVNGAARRVAQGDPAEGSVETLELAWGDAYYPDGRRVPPREYALALALAGQSVQGREVRVQRRDGTSLDLLLSAVPLRSESGEVQGAVATFADITPLKHAQTELRVALEEKDVVLREIGHRFKNNLQLLSNLLTLQSLAVASPEARDALEESQRRVHSMAQLHDQLYRSVEPRPVSMREYLESLTGSLRESYGRAGISLRVEVDDIFLEPERSTPVGLIVSELVTNAFKHAFAAGLTGEIGVEFRRTDGCYTLRLRDTGAGIPEWEAPSPSSLGLRLVRLLAQRLRGELILDTSCGSRFSLTFPADANAE